MKNSYQPIFQRINEEARLVAIDLFCGAGGLTHGLEAAGIKVLAGYDNDPKVRSAYELNNDAKFVLKDIKKLFSSEIRDLFAIQSGEVKTLIAGCAPCQAYSKLQRQKKAEHASYNLLSEFARLVIGVLPDYVLMENVAALEKDESFQAFVSELKNRSYKVDFKVIDFANYGVPQNRKRLILLASRDRLVLIPQNTTSLMQTVKEAIGSLPSIGAGQAHSSDNLHFASRLSNTNLARIQASRPGCSWTDWPMHLLPECYKRTSGKTFKSVYGRLKADEPCGTITTQFNRYGSGRYGHYEQNRALSLREGALLQTFPFSYKFFADKYGVTAIARQIGNAVPPLVAKRLGEILITDAQREAQRGNNAKQN